MFSQLYLICILQKKASSSVFSILKLSIIKKKMECTIIWNIVNKIWTLFKLSFQGKIDVGDVLNTVLGEAMRYIPKGKVCYLLLLMMVVCILKCYAVFYYSILNLYIT